MKRGIILVALIVLFLFSVFPIRVPAQQGPSITVYPSQGPVGTTVQFTVSGYAPQVGGYPNCINVYFGWYTDEWNFSQCVNCPTPIYLNSGGGATGSFTVPPVSPGSHLVWSLDLSHQEAFSSFTVTARAPELITISSYYGTEVYVQHANSADWIKLSDPKNYVIQEGDTISTVTNSILNIDLGSHGTVTLDPDSTIFIHTVSESDVTYSVKGNFYQSTSDTVTVVHSVVNGVPVDEVTDSSTEVSHTDFGDPQFTIAATNTSTLVQVFEGVVSLNDSSGHSVSIGAGNQSSITMDQAPTMPEPISDTTSPSVVSVFPVSSQPTINESMPISVTFSKAIDPSSADGSNFTITDSKGAPVNGNWTVLYQTVIFTPQSSIPSGTYIADVKGGSQGVRDLIGNALPSDYTFTFTVGSAVPEFQPFMLLPVFMTITLLGALILKRSARAIACKRKSALSHSRMREKF